MKNDWKDDMFTETHRKYRMINNDDGTVSFEDVTEYTQQGDAFGAKELNAIGDEVNQAALELEAAQQDLQNKAESNHTHSASDVGAAPETHKHAAGDINSGTLPVARGGTGVGAMTSGAALIGNGENAPTFRAITNLSAKGNASANANLATANTVVYDSQARLNRTTNVNAADTGYTTYMARGIAASAAVPSSLTNGCVHFTYK